MDFKSWLRRIVSTCGVGVSKYRPTPHPNVGRPLRLHLSNSYLTLCHVDLGVYLTFNSSGFGGRRNLLEVLSTYGFRQRSDAGSQNLPYGEVFCVETLAGNQAADVAVQVFCGAADMACLGGVGITGNCAQPHLCLYQIVEPVTLVLWIQHGAASTSLELGASVRGSMQIAKRLFVGLGKLIALPSTSLVSDLPPVSESRSQQCCQRAKGHATKTDEGGKQRSHLRSFRSSHANQGAFELAKSTTTRGISRLRRHQAVQVTDAAHVRTEEVAA